MSDTRKIILRLSVCLLLIVLCILFLTGRKKSDAEPITESGYYLNTVVTITIYDSTDTDLLHHALALCGEYEKKFSRTIESSEIAQLNQGKLADADGISHLSEDTADLIARGLYYSRISNGAFDLSIGPVSSLWDFSSGEHVVPEPEAIEEKLPLVGYEGITLHDQKISFAREGMALDLGAIAKGYIADKIKEYLVGQGITSAIINLGGNVLCIGSRPDGTPFGVGIQKPFADRNETLMAIDVSDRSVVTSGIYERSFEKDGKFYHHLLNPATGYPYENDLTAVTILSDTSTDGDGLSTTCFALGLEKGMDLIEHTENTEAVFITRDGDVHYSSGFPG